MSFGLITSAKDVMCLPLSAAGNSHSCRRMLIFLRVCHVIAKKKRLDFDSDRDHDAGYRNF